MGQQNRGSCLPICAAYGWTGSAFKHAETLAPASFSLPETNVKGNDPQSHLGLMGPVTAACHGPTSAFAVSKAHAG